MIQLIRLAFLPTFAFLGLAGLALSQWTSLSEKKAIATKFHEQSRLVVFKSTGLHDEEGVSYSTYEYKDGGEMKQFASLSQIELPANGKVRLGLDPVDRQMTAYSTWEPGDIAVPINGEDSYSAVYDGLFDSELKADTTKAMVVSLAAVIAGVAGFFLQRIIFKTFNNAARRY